MLTGRARRHGEQGRRHQGRGAGDDHHGQAARRGDRRATSPSSTNEPTLREGRWPSSSPRSPSGSRSRDPTATTRWRSTGTTPTGSSAGRRMEDHLRFAVCYWHSFNWDGFDIFGAGTLDRPWHPTIAPRRRPARGGDRQKMAAAFEFFAKLGVPFYCFHDRDIAPEGGSFKESAALLDEMVDLAAEHQERTGVRLLWGTANLFTNPATRRARRPTPTRRCSPTPPPRSPTAWRPPTASGPRTTCCGEAGRATTPCSTPTCAASSTSSPGSCRWSSSTSSASGSPARSSSSPSRSSRPSTSTTSTSPTVHAFLQRYDLADEIKVNIEVNHATLSGHDFAHEVAIAVNAGIFGSIDANAGDDRLGLGRRPLPGVRRADGARDARDPARRRVHDRRAELRRQAAPPVDRPDRPVPRAHRRDGHDGPGTARRRGRPRRARRQPRGRYAGWDGELGRSILDGTSDARRRCTTGRSTAASQGACRAGRSGSRTSSPATWPAPADGARRRRRLLDHARPRSRSASSTAGGSSGAGRRRTRRPSRRGRSRIRRRGGRRSSRRGARPASRRSTAISVAGQQHGMVALDEHREVVRPAKLWNDTESAPDAAWLIGQLPGGRAGVGRRRVASCRWPASRSPSSRGSTAASRRRGGDWPTWCCRTTG